MKKLNIKKLLVLLLATVVVIALNGCSGDKQTSEVEDSSSSSQNLNEPQMGGSIVVGIPQDIEDSLDPHVAVAAGTSEILFNVYEGLVKPDKDGNLIDAVASEHEIKDAGKKYIFTLREGIKFHDGSLVTVDDIIYSIKNLADVGKMTSVFSNVEKVEAIDDKTVEITLKEADTEFLAFLTSAIVPKDTDVAKNPIGTGPYKYISRNPGENIIMEKFVDYWGDEAYLDKITYKIITDGNVIVTNLKSGSIDLFQRLTTSQSSQVEDICDIYEGTMNLVQALYLNNKVKPFDDVKVRQALCYAVNPQEIMDFISDGKGVEIGSSMFPTFGKYYVPELTKTYDVNIEKAKSLLVEAGYPDGFEFTITVPSNYQPHVDTAQVLVEQFAKIGVTAKIQTVEWASWLSDVYMARDYDSTVIGVDASSLTGRALLERFLSTAGNNFINYNNSTYDEVYSKIRKTSDENEQVELYKELQKILSEDAANVYIQDMANMVALNKKYGGYEFYPLYVLDMSKIYLKK